MHNMTSLGAILYNDIMERKRESKNVCYSQMERKMDLGFPQISVKSKNLFKRREKL